MLHPYPPGIAEKLLSLAASFAQLLMGLFKALWGAENVIQTILGVLVLLAIYALCYGLYLVVRKRRFISIASFSVWGSSPPQYPGEGIAARLGDELLKLQRDMLKSRHGAESRGTFIPGADLVFSSPEHLKQPANFTTMRSVPSSLEQRTEVNFYSAPLAKAIEAASFYTVRFEPGSPAQVRVEYKGFSPQVFNSFLRRLFHREHVITGDLIPFEQGLLLVGRSSGVGPWEVQTERSDTSALHQLLQEMAVRAVIDLHPKTKLAVGNALAWRQRKAEAAQDLDESLRQARLATIALPEEGTSFYNLGVALAGKGQFDDAIAAYNKALQLRPDFPEALNNLGVALGNKAQFDDAITALNKALQIKPDYLEALNNLGAALDGKGQFDEAIAVYNKALQIKPDEPKALYNLGGAFASKGQFDEAIAAYNKALQLKPDYPKAFNNLGIALAHKGQLDDAIVALNKALQLKPDDPEVLSNLGAALANKDQLDDAIAAYQKALQLKPDYPEALNNLGLALARKDLFNDAIAALNRALQFNPNNASLHYNLGLILRKAGKREEARRAFAKAQQLDPKFKPPDPQ